MYKSNKDIPPTVLSLLQPYYKKQNELFYKVSSNPNYLLRYNDSDPNSSFFFEITTYTADPSGTVTFGISYKPLSHSIETKKIVVSHKSLEQHFNLWFNCIKSYTTLLGPADSDFILKQYQDEFVSEFQMVDEDSDTNSFDYEKQVFLDKYLEKVVLFLEEAKTTNNTPEIAEIIQDVEELRTNQTRLTKQIVIQRVSKIFAKVRKISLSLLSKVKEEAIKELVKEGVKAGIKAGITYLTIG